MSAHALALCSQHPKLHLLLTAGVLFNLQPTVSFHFQATLGSTAFNKSKRVAQKHLLFLWIQIPLLLTTTTKWWDFVAHLQFLDCNGWQFDMPHSCAMDSMIFNGFSCLSCSLLIPCHAFHCLLPSQKRKVCSWVHPLTSPFARRIWYWIFSCPCLCCFSCPHLHCCFFPPCNRPTSLPTSTLNLNQA